MRFVYHHPLTVTVAPAPGGRRAPYHTVGVMRAMVEEFKCAPSIIQTAINLILFAPPRDEYAEVKAIFDYVRGSVRYVRDVVGIETLADPVTTLRRMVGDCDDKATLLATLLEAVGYPCRFVIAAYSDGEYEHVYLQCFFNRQWHDLDPTEDGAIGYSPPDPVRVWIEPAY